MAKNTNLTYALEKTLSELDEEKVLSYNDWVLITNSLEDFIVTSIRKFIKGQKEHGGKITDRDLDIEIDQEHIDLFWYLAARKSKTRAS